MEKQRVLLEELRRKLDLDLENFDKLTAEELKEIVDHAVGSVSAPTKMKMPCLWKRGLGPSAFAVKGDYLVAFCPWFDLI